MSAGTDLLHCTAIGPDDIMLKNWFSGKHKIKVNVLESFCKSLLNTFEF